MSPYEINRYGGGEEEEQQQQAGCCFLHKICFFHMRTSQSVIYCAYTMATYHQPSLKIV